MKDIDIHLLGSSSGVNSTHIIIFNGIHRLLECVPRVLFFFLFLLVGYGHMNSALMRFEEVHMYVAFALMQTIIEPTGNVLGT